MIDIKDLENKIINADCLDILKELPDKCVDLVLTDPPYGIDYGGQLIKGEEFKFVTNKHGWRNFGNNEWDKERPSEEIFKQILRVSKNQIIWGGNYFADFLPASQGWLVWNKGQRDFTLADGELAWTSFDRALRIFDYSRAKALQDGKIHPTQKPLQLMQWCLEKGSNVGDLVLDCFSGSGTTAIACHRLKRRFICIEKDKDYYEASVKRLEDARKQLTLF
jgi:site-specific DNA-methyltransferase (adenine-specific)